MRAPVPARAGISTAAGGGGREKSQAQRSAIDKAAKVAADKAGHTAPDIHTETHIETVREKILTLEISHKTPQEMAKAYTFSDRQNSCLTLLTLPGTAPLWAQLLGPPFAGGIITPDTTWEGTGIFQWPLPESFTITTYFGNREDPFTGEPSYHDGTDIAAPAGTPILAAAAGTVETANSTDSWGGGYGYYVKIRHDSSLETLYAHCSFLCVSAG